MSRFTVPEEESAQFVERAEAAVAAFAGRPGFLRGRVARAVDDPGEWVLTTEWEGIGAYRRSLSGYDVKVHAAPLLATSRDEPSAYEVLSATDGADVRRTASGRASDADSVGVGEAAGPVVPS